MGANTTDKAVDIVSAPTFVKAMHEVIVKKEEALAAKKAGAALKALKLAAA